jgi:hypothetical protein
MTPPDFVAQVRAADPRLSAVVEEHLADNDQLLLHLLVADLRREAEAAHAADDVELRDQVLALMDSAMAGGDAATRDAVAISFVEDSGWWEPDRADYFTCWPQAFRLELSRQRDART